LLVPTPDSPNATTLSQRCDDPRPTHYDPRLRARAPRTDFAWPRRRHLWPPYGWPEVQTIRQMMDAAVQSGAPILHRPDPILSGAESLDVAPPSCARAAAGSPPRPRFHALSQLANQEGAGAVVRYRSESCRRRRRVTTCHATCGQIRQSDAPVEPGALSYRGWPLAAACSGFSDPSLGQIGGMMMVRCQQDGI
jgi:hypothetical protein